MNQGEAMEPTRLSMSRIWKELSYRYQLSKAVIMYLFHSFSSWKCFREGIVFDCVWKDNKWHPITSVHCAACGKEFLR